MIFSVSVSGIVVAYKLVLEIDAEVDTAGLGRNPWAIRAYWDASRQSIHNLIVEVVTIMPLS
jgi:hypothetical protein